jgi:hypothetical protein
VQSSGGQAQTTGNGPGAVAEESFFDPRSIEGKPELQAAYKQMQGEFTKHMQKFATQRQRLDLVERFERDPIGTLNQIVPNYGYQLVQRGQDQQSQDQDFKSWDDVKNYFFKEFEKEKLNPVVNEVRSLKKQNVEAQLDRDFPDWRTYEGSMMDVLKAHPTLVNDPGTLYRMAVPASVLEARATKAAMEKLRGATEHAQVSGATTAKQTTTAPTGKLSFNQAVEAARARLQQQGLRAPVN